MASCLIDIIHRVIVFFTLRLSSRDIFCIKEMCMFNLISQINELKVEKSNNSYWRLKLNDEEFDLLNRFEMITLCYLILDNVMELNLFETADVYVYDCDHSTIIVDCILIENDYIEV